MSELEFAALRHKILQLGLQGDLVLQSKREPVRAHWGAASARRSAVCAAYLLAMGAVASSGAVGQW